MDAGARTSLFQIKRRACGGRPMTVAAARVRRRMLRAARGTRRCIVIDTCSFGDSSPKMCSRHGPYSFCVCPRSFNQALLLSTRWMFGRVNRMVVIGRFGCVFWCEGGWWRTPIRAGQAQRAPMRRVACCRLRRCRQSARVKLRVVSQRVRAIGHCLQRSMRCTNELAH